MTFPTFQGDALSVQYQHAGFGLVTKDMAPEALVTELFSKVAFFLADLGLV